MEFDNLLKLINTVSSSSLKSFAYEEEGLKIRMRADRTGEESPVVWKKEVCQDAPVFLEESKQEGNLIKSPLVGTFYSAPSENEPSFVKVGDTVKAGQVLAIVEAMKLMNEIESEFDGVVAEVFVENAQSVEYGQPLFRII